MLTDIKILMGIKSSKIKGGALAYALVISLLITLMIMALIIKNTLSEKIDNSYLLQLKLQKNAQSGLVLLDQIQSLDTNFTVDLFNQGNDSVSLTKSLWGCFILNKLKAVTKSNKYELYALTGFSHNQNANFSLIVPFTGNKLSIAGDSKIIGKAKIPYGNYNVIALQKTTFTGSFERSKIETSTGDWPELDANLIKSLKTNFENASLDTNANYTQITEPLFSTTLSNDFENKTQVIEFKNDVLISNCKIEGNITLKSNYKITVDSSANLSDILIFAKNIKITSGFIGSVQAFAADTMITGANCSFNYPSCLGITMLDVNPKNMYLELGEKSIIYGGILSISILANHRNPKLNTCLKEQSKVFGCVYAQGAITPFGAIYGQLTSDRIVYSSNSSVFEHVLFNSLVDNTKIFDAYALPLFYVAEKKEKSLSKWLTRNYREVR